MAKNKSNAFFALESLRGGLDDSTPPHAMADDACMVSENIEQYFSTIAERRAGMESLDLTEAPHINGSEAIVHLSKHNPTIDEADAELFVVGVEFNLEAFVALYSQGGWAEIAPVDPIDPDEDFVTKINATTLHGKHFVAYKSEDDTDRLHVWDGSIFRRVGLRQPSGNNTATAFIRSDDGDSTITITIDAVGTDGNEYTITVVNGSGNNVALSAAISGTSITVTLGTDGSGVPDPTKNTVTLVEAAIEALSGVSSTITGLGTNIIANQGPKEFSDGGGILVTATSDSGTYTETRWFRVRFVKKDGLVTELRSEPTESTQFIPDGTKDGAIISRPALINEGETHWEVEASEEGPEANFYRIATVPITTLTYEDNTNLSVEDYEDIGILSEDIGDYTVPGSAKYLSVDQDRLLLGSSWEEDTYNARIWWSPVFNDPGVGNDERIPLDTDNFLDLDTFEGGGLTGLSNPVNGSIYAFKWGQIFRLTRTGARNHAYEAVVLSKTCGALPGSIVHGLDEYGRACVYFLDPASGPYRVGINGLQRMKGLRNLWRRMNTGAGLVSTFGVYYPDKQQVHWWLALDSNDIPNFKIISQVNELRENQDGVSRGWTTATGDITNAYCGCIMSELTERETGAVALNYRPYIGLAAPSYLQRCDIGTTDDGTEYRAIIRSKPFFFVGLLNKWGDMAGALLATAIDEDDGGLVQVKLIRDFGKEGTYLVTDLEATNEEEFVVKIFDHLKMTNAIGIQFEFSDPEDDSLEVGVLYEEEAGE
jgi:hypothetical protein